MSYTFSPKNILIQLSHSQLIHASNANCIQQCSIRPSSLPHMYVALEHFRKSLSFADYKTEPISPLSTRTWPLMKATRHWQTVADWLLTGRLAGRKPPESRDRYRNRWSSERTETAETSLSDLAKMKKRLRRENCRLQTAILMTFCQAWLTSTTQRRLSGI